MTTVLRESGFSALGPVTWGSHLCHFYESRSELLGVTAEFLHAGLSHREAGVWVAPALLKPDKARHMLTRTAPALARYIDSGQLQILDGARFYTHEGTGFNGGATVSLWSTAVNEALGRGFEGLRVAGDGVCSETTNWNALLDYEATLKHKLASRPIIGLCTYCISQLRAAQARELERLHDATVESPAPARAHSRVSVQARARSRVVSPAPAGSRDNLNADALHATVGHEIRNAITPLGLVAQLLTKQYAHDEQLTRYALLLSRQADLLAQLAQQLMTPAEAPISKLIEADTEEGVPELKERSRASCVDVAELLAHCIQVSESCIPGHDPIALAPADTPLQVQGEFGQLTQVFVNLMTNALKYSAPSEQVNVSASRAGRYCYISVRDNGVGIGSKELANIFKPYDRGGVCRVRGVGGMGLGLAVVREIVAALGGTVDAYSNGPGCGSEFVVRLPLTSISMPEDRHGNAAKQTPLDDVIHRAIPRL